MKNQDRMNKARQLISEALQKIRRMHFNLRENSQIIQIKEDLEDAFAILDNGRTKKTYVTRLHPKLPDYVSDFVTERLVQTNDPTNRIQASVLYQAYKDYCLEKGDKAVITTSAFGLRMNQIGIIKMKASECNYYICIRMKNNQDIIAEENDYYSAMGIAEV